MNKRAERLAEIETKNVIRNDRKELRIDLAMMKAWEVFNLCSENDPYAMHKAVESLPTVVLLDILGRRASDELGGKTND